MKRNKSPWDIMVVALMAAVAGVGLQSHQFAFAQEQEELEGPIVQIGPEKGNEATPVTDQDPAAPQETSYWIGLRGRGVEDPVLRTQLQLAEDMGIVIEDIVPKSPAEKAGLRKHDIILRANDDVVDSMETLQQHVQTGQDKPLELQLLRLGKEITITVTPEQRPADYQQQVGVGNEFGLPGQEMLGGDVGRLLQQLQGGAGLPGMRVIGPGMVLGNRDFDVNAVPNGISVSIARNGEGPAQITVKKGDQTWTVNSDDEKALADLPEDVRGFVSGMLNGQGGINVGNLDLEGQLRHAIPRHLGNIPGMGDFQGQEDELAKRMQEMEKQLDQLRQRLDEEAKAAE